MRYVLPYNVISASTVYVSVCKHLTFIMLKINELLLFFRYHPFFFSSNLLKVHVTLLFHIIQCIRLVPLCTHAIVIWLPSCPAISFTTFKNVNIVFYEQTPFLGQSFFGKLMLIQTNVASKDHPLPSTYSLRRLAKTKFLSMNKLGIACVKLHPVSSTPFSWCINFFQLRPSWQCHLQAPGIRFSRQAQKRNQRGEKCSHSRLKRTPWGNSKK